MARLREGHTPFGKVFQRIIRYLYDIQKYVINDYLEEVSRRIALVGFPLLFVMCMKIKRKKYLSGMVIIYENTRN